MLHLRPGRQSAFALMELLVVSALLVVLIILIFPSWNKVSEIWNRCHEHLRIAEARERLFQKFQEDWNRIACHLEEEEDDFQITDDGSSIILPCRRKDQGREYVLWHGNASTSEPTGDEVYRVRLSEYSESSKTLCSLQPLNGSSYRSFRQMFPEFVATTTLSPDLFADQVVSWQIQYVGERDLNTEDDGHALVSSHNRLVYEDFPAFFSWRAWMRGDISLAFGPKWLAITIAILPSSWRQQWENVSSADRKNFLQQHGFFRTQLLPFYGSNGT